MKILHLSDLHFSADKSIDNRIVVDALIRDLDNIPAEDKPDFVVFTGDLVKAGDNAQDFDVALKDVVQPLLQKIGIDRSQFFLVPGNHDIRRDSVRRASYIQSGLTSELTSVDRVNRFIDEANSDPSRHAQALERMSHYRAIEKLHNFGMSIYISEFVVCHRVVIRGLKVGVAAFNTAWMSTGEGDDIDKGKLLLGERSVDIALSELSDAHVKIALMHHPLSWLRPFDESAVVARLYSGFDALFVGHSHQSWPEVRIAPTGTCLISQAGCLYETRRYSNSYQCVHLDMVENAAEVRVRTYQPTRNEFDKAVDLAPDGLIKIHFQSRRKIPIDAELQLHLRELRPVIRAAAIRQISLSGEDEGAQGTDLIESFICPPLARNREHESTLVDASAFIEVDQLLRSPENWSIYGKRETGKTSLAHYLAVHASEGQCDIARIPVVIDFAHVRHGDRPLRRAIRTYFFESEHALRNLDRLLKADLLVIVDNVDATLEVRRYRLLEKLVEENPGTRWIFIRPQETLLGISKQPGEVLKFSPAYIHSLPRKTIRQMAKRLGGTIDEAKTYDLIMDQLRRTKLPRTGYIVSLLIWAVQQRKSLERINESVLLENVIDFLLSKGDYTLALRKEFDFISRRITLQHIAIFLKDRAGYANINELNSYVIQFFSRRGLDYDASSVVSLFVMSGVLKREGDSIAFKYQCFQEYFIAYQMREDPSLYKAIVRGESIFRYVRELDLMSGLERQTDAIVNDVRQRIEELQPKFVREQEPFLALKVKGLPTEFSLSRMREIKANPLTPEQIDDMLDRAERRMERMENVHEAELDKEDVDKGIAVREPVEDATEAFKFFTVLELYGHVIRNAEFINAQDKSEHIADFVGLWARSIGAFMGFLDKALDEFLGSEERIKAGVTEIQVDIIRRVSKLIVPIATSEALSQQVGSDKLVPTIIRRLNGEATTVSEKLLLLFILLDVFAAGWDDLWRGFARENKSDPYILLLLVEKIYLYSRTHALREIDRAKVVNIIADIEIFMGVPKNSKEAIKQKISSGLDVSSE